MIFTPTPLDGACLIEPRPREDDRGWFARILCAEEFRQNGLRLELTQTNMALTHRRATLRGLHFQAMPHEEIKIIRCTKGAIYDVIVDLRTQSPTFKKWFGAELTQDNFRALYVPEGFAHGYLTLTDGAEIYYHTSKAYDPQSAFGVRFDDPEFEIEWPIPISVISAQDRSWPDFAAQRADRFSHQEVAQ